MENQEITPEQQENEEEPQVFSVTRDVSGTHFNRRKFVEKAVVTSAALSVVAAGCTLPGLPKVDTQATVESAIQATENARKLTEIAAEAAKPVEQAPVEVEPTVDVPTNTATSMPTATEILPTETATVPPKPTGIETTIKGDTVNFRAGPGTGYSSITRLPYGSIVLLTSRLKDSSWVGAALADPKRKGAFVEGWIKTTLVVTAGKDIQSLPVIENIPPTPTPLPGKYGTTGVGQTGIDYTYTDEYGNVFPYTLPCGSAIPPGAVCTCNCVTVPRTCSCDGHVGCGCDSLHYWYPN